MSFFSFKRNKQNTVSDEQNEQSCLSESNSSSPGAAAIARWLVVLESSPTDINAKIQIVQLSISENNLSHGDAMYSLLEREHAKSLASKIVRARWQQHKGNYDQARALWAEVEEKKPGSFESLSNLAHIDLAEGKLDDAWRRAEEILDRGSVDLIHKGYLVKARVHSKRGELPEEVEAWRLVLEHTDKHQAAELNYCAGLFKLGRYHDLLERIDGSIEKYNGHVKLTELKCECLIKTDSIEQALAMNLSRGTDTENNLGVLYQRAALQLRLDQFEDAEVNCEKILAKDPTHLKALTLFARIAQMKANAA